MCWDTDSCNTMVINRVLKFWSGHKYGGRCGGLMVRIVRSTLEQEVKVRALAGDIVYCCVLG